MQKDELVRIRKRFLLTKVFTILYVVCLSIVYLTSSTEAQFTSTRINNQVIQAGEWWDGSALVFTGTNDQSIASCDPIELAVTIKNDSRFGMYGTSEYEVYHASTQHKVTEENLEIAMMASGATSILTYTVAGPGDYVFLAYQRPTYEQNEVERTRIMSEVITVTCIEESVSPEAINKEEASSDVLEDEQDATLPEKQVDNSSEEEPVGGGEADD